MTLQQLYIAVRVDHEENPKNCLSLLGYGSKQECERFVLDSMKADLEFAAEQDPVAEALRELVQDSGGDILVSNLGMALNNCTDSQIEALHDQFVGDSVSHHVMKPGN